MNKTASGQGVNAEGNRLSQRGVGVAAVDWLTDMSLVQASRTAEVDGYIGYMEPYATAHQALDEDSDFQEETRNAARALANAVKLSRAGKYQSPDEGLRDPNPK